MNSNSAVGKSKRLSRLFDSKSGRTVIVPIDDSLIFGPYDGLADLSTKVKEIAEAKPNGVLAFSGVFREFSQLLLGIGGIINLTASTVHSTHTRKVMVGDVHGSLSLDPEAIGVHVNVTSRYEAEMLNNLGLVSKECDSLGIPLLAIMYPRKEVDGGDENYNDMKKTNPDEYSKLISHCVRIAADLGADLIKTQFTGSSRSFERVVKACWPIPVVVAGGPQVHPNEMMKNAYAAIEGGATGVSFGRNVFNRADSRKFISALKEIVHNGLPPSKAVQMLQ